ncbi:MAG: DUF4112 domain-containing protein [Mangrovibacterium sp.]
MNSSKVSNVSILQDGKNQEARKRRMEQIELTKSYRLMLFAEKVFDGYYLDPIFTILSYIPGLLPIVQTICLLVYFNSIYCALAVVKSFRLTLIVVYEALLDILVGIIPVFGIILDFTNKGHTKIARYVMGYVEGDRKIIREINGSTAKAIFGIAVFAILIYLIIVTIGAIMKWFIGLF